MVYAYDKNIQMPVMDLYDNLIMAMAINAAKDLYDDAQKRLDEFYDKYGDFYSPFKKDMERYDKIVTNRINNVIDDIYTNGGDPLRNAKDRAYLTRELRKLPIGEINQMRRNAKIGEIYLQNAAKLAQENKYNPDMSAWEDGSFDEFSTVGDNGALNTWEKYSPSAYQDIDLLLEPIISNTKLMYDEEKTKADKNGRIWKTITLPRLMSQFNDSMSDILSTPSGRYLLAQSQKEADVINANYPGSNITAMDVLRNKAENRLRDHVQEEASYDPLYLKRIDDQYKRGQLRLAASLRNPQPTKNEGPLQLSLRIQMLIDQNRNENIRRFIKSYAQASMNRAKAFENKGKKAKYGSAYWADIIKQLDDPKSKIDLGKHGLVDKYGNPTQKVVDYAIQQYKKGNKGEKYWNTLSYTPGSDYERDLTRTLFSGSERSAKIQGVDYNVISLGDKGVRYAPYRYAQLLGNEDKLTKMQLAFSEWIDLKSENVQGYVDNSPIDIANILGSRGRNVTDTRGNVLISENDLYRFAELYGKQVLKSGKSASNILLQVVSELGFPKRIDNTYENPETYYVVPIIRSSNITMDDINNQYNKLIAGTTNAAGERNIATEEGGYKWPNITGTDLPNNLSNYFDDPYTDLILNGD